MENLSFRLESPVFINYCEGRLNLVPRVTPSFYYRPQTNLRGGNVFTPVCDSVHTGWGRGSLSKLVSLSSGISVKEGLSRGGLCPAGVSVQTVEERAVRILLECILIFLVQSRALCKNKTTTEKPQGRAGSYFSILFPETYDKLSENSGG